MAQRTEKNPPYGYKFYDKVVEDITELFDLSGGFLTVETQSLQNVLNIGNDTGTNNIIMGTGTYIGAVDESVKLNDDVVISGGLTVSGTASLNDVVIATGKKITDVTLGNTIEFINIFLEGAVLTTDSTGPNLGPFTPVAQYNSVAPVSTSGNGVGLIVRFVRRIDDNSFGIANIIVPGSGYEVGDTISFLGTQYGLSSPADDITYTILGVAAETNYTKISAAGFNTDDEYNYNSGIEIQPTGTITSTVNNEDTGDYSQVNLGGGYAYINAAAGSSNTILMIDPGNSTGHGFDTGTRIEETDGVNTTSILINPTTGVNISGNEISLNSSTVSVNNAYTIPTTDGTPNQVLTTNGSGVSSWTTAGAESLSDTLVVGNDTGVNNIIMGTGTYIRAADAGFSRLTLGLATILESDDGATITMTDTINFKTDTNSANINTSNLTANRSFLFPNASGTLALTSDITANNELSEILANGNDTGVNNIIMGTATLINGKGGSSIQMDYDDNGTPGVRILGSSGYDIIAGEYITLRGDGCNLILSDTADITSALYLGNGFDGSISVRSNKTLNIGTSIDTGTVSIGNSTQPVVFNNGDIVVNNLPTTNAGLSSGQLFTQTASQLGGTGSTKVICIV